LVWRSEFLEAVGTVYTQIVLPVFEMYNPILYIADPIVHRIRLLSLIRSGRIISEAWETYKAFCEHVGDEGDEDTICFWNILPNEPAKLTPAPRDEEI